MALGLMFGGGPPPPSPLDPLGTPIWLIKFNALSNRLVAEAENALRNLSAQCQKALAGDNINLGAVEATTASTTYYDAAIPPEGGFEVRDISGYANPLNPSQTLAQYLGTARAATLPNAAGTGGANFVVVGTSFFTQIAYGGSLLASQDITLVHEALHTGTGLGDSPLAQKLGLGKMPQNAASTSISLWLALGCPPAH